MGAHYRPTAGKVSPATRYLGNLLSRAGSDEIAQRISLLSGTSPDVMSCATVTGGRVGGTMCGAEPALGQFWVSRMHRFSLRTLLTGALTGHQGWERQWRSPEPKAAYDAVIVGGGGHGLATAYYLAKEHGLTNIAVLEKGWIGGGNTGRNTTIIRSNYLYDESAAIYEHALEAVGRPVAGAQLQRHVLAARRADARAQRARRAEPQAPRLRQPAERHRQRVADAEQAKAFCPPLNISPHVALSRGGRRPAAARRRRAPRCGRVGLCARRRRHGRRHHPELRGDRLHARRRRRRRRRRDHAGARSARRAWASSRPATPAW